MGYYIKNLKGVTLDSPYTFFSNARQYANNLSLKMAQFFVKGYNDMYDEAIEVDPISVAKARNTIIQIIDRCSKEYKKKAAKDTSTRNKNRNERKEENNVIVETDEERNEIIREQNRENENRGNKHGLRNQEIRNKQIERNREETGMECRRAKRNTVNNAPTADNGQMTFNENINPPQRPLDDVQNGIIKDNSIIANYLIAETEIQAVEKLMNVIRKAKDG